MRSAFLTPASLLAALALLLLNGCQTTAPQSPPLTANELTRALPEDKKVLQNIASHNGSIQREFLSLKASGDWRKRGYFSAKESDRLEALMFRIRAAHNQLAEITERYDQLPAGHSSASDAKSLASRANRLAHQQTRFMVDTFADDPIAIEKINQAYPRSEIPRDTYAHLSESLHPPAQRELAHIGRAIEDGWDDSSYKIQAEVFFHVSRLKSPGSHLLRFSDAQKQQLSNLLEPGDLILTYTGGYASSAFIPGVFKHGMTYIGTTEQRKAAGLTPDRIAMVGEGHERQLLMRNLHRTQTRDGRPADLIEAVAEGVKFSNLDHILDTHISRLLVLRPRLDSGDRARQLVRTFSYLGQPYDFRFDFADSSKQVCTEVIYRALNGLNGIDFTLTERAGHVTLSADDLIHYWIDRNPDAFEFVLLADKSRIKPGHRAVIRTGTSGNKRLRKIMAPSAED